MNNAKIAVVCFTGNSGLTDYSVSLCRALSAACGVELVTAESIRQAYPDRLLTFPLSTPFKRTRQYPAGIVKLVLCLYRGRPDWVLFQSFLKFPLLETLLVLFLRRLLRIKVALTIHDLLPHYPKPWSRLIHKAYYNCFDKLIVHSERTLSDLAGMGVAIPARVIPHGRYDLFDLDMLDRSRALAFFPEIRAESYVALFFGHVEKRKGIFSFLETARKAGPDGRFTFVVAGSNDLAGAERDHFNKYRELSNVVLHDRRIPFEEVQRYFALADVVVLPYLEGTTSGVLKLAASFGKPVIATRVGDIAEMVNDGDGLLVEETEEELPKALLDALIQVKSISNAGIRAWQGQGGWAWHKCGALYHDFLLNKVDRG